jgi:hypothetical protein
MIGPSWLADGSSAVALITLHLVTALVVICGFAGIIPVQGNGNARTKTVARTSTP